MERTLPLRLFSASQLMLASGIAIVLVTFVIPHPAEGGRFAVILVPAMIVFLVLAAVAVVSSGARRRRLWMLAAIPGVVVTALFWPFISFDIVHPVNVWPFATAVLVITGVVLAVATGVAIVRGAPGVPAAEARPRRVWITATGLVAGLLLGALGTAAAAASSAGTGAGTISGRPDRTLVMHLKDTRFEPRTLELRAGEVLGLFIVNDDPSGHTFDIDALNVHVQVPANATVAISVVPKGDGQLAFYCAIPGHRDAGMAGTISVS